MLDKLKEHLGTVIIVGLILFFALRPDKPTEFKRWAYIAADKNAVQWERVIAHIDSQDNGEAGVWFYVYAIEYPDTGEIYDAMATYQKLSTSDVEHLSVPELSEQYYIRLTSEKYEE